MMFAWLEVADISPYFHICPCYNAQHRVRGVRYSSAGLNEKKIFVAHRNDEIGKFVINTLSLPFKSSS